MSDGHDHDHDDAADAHHDHDFDGEPAKELPPDEPHTPGWVPLVGAAVFVVGAVFLVTQREAAPPGSEDGKPATAQTVAAPQQPRPAQPVQAQPRPAQPGQAQPAGSDAANVKRLTPDQIKDLQKRIQDAKQKKEAAGGN